MNRYLTQSALFGLTLFLASSAWAVRPGRITHTTEADFSTGQTENTVVTSLGDIQLAAATASLSDLSQLDPPAQVIFDLLPLQGNLYIAAGPHPRILCLQNNTLTTLLSLSPAEQVFCLAPGPQNQPLAAVSGSPSRILEFRDGRWFRLLELPTVRYIWDMLLQADTLYLATGTDGQLLAVNLSQLPAPQPEPPFPPASNHSASPPTPPASEPSAPSVSPPLPQGVRLLLKVPQSNLLCLGIDASGTLFVGTDTDGLVYRLRPSDDPPVPFVLFDAPEPEIGALAVLPDGTVYVGTADASRARSSPLRQPSDTSSGRPVLPAEPTQPSQPPPTPPKPQPGPSSSTPLSNSSPSLDSADSPLPAHALPDPSLDALRQLLSQHLENSPSHAPVPSSLTTEDLEEAEESPQPQPSASASTVPGPASAESSAPQGNAIYRIDPHGFVRELFRESLMIFALLPHNDYLLAGTGDQGLLYRLDLPKEETTILANLQAQHISALAFDSDRDRILIATTNPARLFALENRFAASGQYTSAPIDARQVSLWGTLHLTAHIPPTTRLLLQTRTGNSLDPDRSPWSPWSSSVAFEPGATDPAHPRPVPLTNPPGRFLQYRLTFQSTGSDTPVVDRIDLTFLTPNLKPSVTSLQTAYAEPVPQPSAPTTSSASSAPVPSEPSEPSPILQITWQASDPNNDRLLYQLEYRRSDSPLWLSLAKDLTESRFYWNTRHVPDGWYFLRLTASDLPDNPPDLAQSVSRLSDPILIDNTPPEFSCLQQEIINQTLILRFTVQDSLSPIQAVHYLLDANPHWQLLLPQDHLADSTSETFTIKIPQLAPGPHLITLRALDARGNIRYHALPFEIPQPPAPNPIQTEKQPHSEPHNPKP